MSSFDNTNQNDATSSNATSNIASQTTTNNATSNIARQTATSNATSYISSQTTINKSTYQCTSCNIRRFSTYRGLNQHLRTCLRKPVEQINDVTLSQPVSIQSTTETLVDANNVITPLIKWGEVSLQDFTEAVNIAYDKIVYWRKIYFYFLLVQLESHI